MAAELCLYRLRKVEALSPLTKRVQEDCMGPEVWLEAREAVALIVSQCAVHTAICTAGNITEQVDLASPSHINEKSLSIGLVLVLFLFIYLFLFYFYPSHLNQAGWYVPTGSYNRV
jgi:hypothetical protein